MFPVTELDTLGSGTQPEVTGTKPEVLSAGTKPEVAGTKPEVAGTKPEGLCAGTKPEVVGPKPEVAGTKPEVLNAGAKPEVAGADPEIGGTELGFISIVGDAKAMLEVGSSVLILIRSALDGEIPIPTRVLEGDILFPGRGNRSLSAMGHSLGDAIRSCAK